MSAGDKDPSKSGVVVVPLRELVTSLSINPNGAHAVLAAKRGLFLLDLREPFRAPTAFKHTTKWEVIDVTWNPHSERSYWIASTVRQNVFVKFENIIATCGYDNFVHIWDLRLRSGSYQENDSLHGPGGTPGRSSLAIVMDKPKSSFCSWTSGATAVKWNKISHHLLASAHDSDLHLWDLRMTSAKERKLLSSIHMGKIYGIDWSPRTCDEILTCSQDMTVKVWNFNLGSEVPPTTSSSGALTGTAAAGNTVFVNGTKLEGIIPTGNPARYTPFGNGIISMPLRKDLDLTLWKSDSLRESVAKFSGHTDVVKEFVWRKCGDDDFQLVTWSKDQTLRLWPIDSKLKATIGHKPGQQFFHSALNQTFSSSTSPDAFLDPSSTASISASPNVHSQSPSIVSTTRSAGANTKTSSGVSELGMPNVRDSSVYGKSKAPKQWVFSTHLNVEESSEAGSFSGESHPARPQSLKSVPTAGMSVFDLENELNEYAKLLRAMGNGLTVDGIDVPTKSIAITIKRLFVNPEMSAIRVNITFQDEATHSPSPRHSASSSSLKSVDVIRRRQTAVRTSSLTAFPSFEILRSEMVPWVQRQPLNTRLQNLNSFLVSKKIPTFEPCLRFLIFDDPNVGVEPGAVGYISGFESAISSSSALIPTGSGFGGVPVGPALSRNVSGFLTTAMNPKIFSSSPKGLAVSFEEETDAVSAVKASSVLSEGMKLVKSEDKVGSIGGQASLNSDRSETVESVNSTDGVPVGRSSGTHSFIQSDNENSEDERLIGVQSGFAGYRQLVQSGQSVGHPSIKDGGGIPFPRLCGAVFSISGHLVCFFSPLPHPTAVKFLSHGMGGQRPTTSNRGLNVSHPRNFQMFQQYRNFLVQKFPPITTSQNQLPNSLTAGAHSFGFLGQTRENWVARDEDDVDGESSLGNLLMRPANTNFEATVSTAILLRRLRQHGVSKPIQPMNAESADSSGELNDRRPSAASPSANPSLRPSMFIVGSVEDLASTDSAEAISNLPEFATPSSVLNRRDSRARAKSMQLDSLGMPFLNSSPRDLPPMSSSIRKSASNNNSPTSSYSASKAHTEQHRTASWKSESDMSANALPGTDKLTDSILSGGGCGLCVFIKDIKEMLPVSEVLAREYTLIGADPVAICSANSIVAAKNHRSDLAKLWTIAGLVLGRVCRLKRDHVKEPSAEIGTGTTKTPNFSVEKSSSAFGSKRRESIARVGKLGPLSTELDNSRKDLLTIRRDGTFSVQNQSASSSSGFDAWMRADWGNHPLGRSLVGKIEPFGKTQDSADVAGIEAQNSWGELLEDYSPVGAFVTSIPSSYQSPVASSRSSRLYKSGNSTFLTTGPLASLQGKKEMRRGSSRSIKAAREVSPSETASAGSFPYDLYASIIPDPKIFGRNSGASTSSEAVLSPQARRQGFRSSYGASSALATTVSVGAINDGSESEESENPIEVNARAPIGISEPSRAHSFVSSKLGYGLQEESQCENNYSLLLLSPLRQHLYDEYKLKYAEILFAWGLLDKRAEVLKFVSARALERTQNEFKIVFAALLAGIFSLAVLNVAMAGTSFI
ncbi:hypothetical protein HDU83_005054 [Entophlyctis luteolus]|nr:hypothetical protein HDU83_005054 [Entophlyctis luteolus]